MGAGVKFYEENFEQSMLLIKPNNSVTIIFHFDNESVEIQMQINNFPLF